MRFPQLRFDPGRWDNFRLAVYLLAGLRLAVPALAAPAPGIGYLLQALEGPKAVDAQGNTYTYGNVNGLVGTLPPATAGAVYSAPSTTPDVSSYLVKLDANGKVVYRTYMIGSAVDYRNNTVVRMSAIAADASGNLFIAGTTSDAPGKTYIAEVDPNGTKLLYYQTFAGIDYVLKLAADGLGSVYVAGATDGTSFPVTGGAFCTSSTGNTFVLKLNPRADKPVYGCLISGTLYGFGVDGSGNAYIAGTSTKIPVTTRDYKKSDGGNFIAELNASGSALVYAAYWPTNIGAITVDAAGSVFLTGSAFACGTGACESLPITPGTYTPGSDGWSFIAKLNPGGGSLAFCARADGQYGSTIVLDSSGNPIISGFTNSRNFPTLHPIQIPSPGVGAGFCYYYLPAVQTPENCGTGFIAKYDATGQRLLWASYLGSTGIVERNGLVGADAAGNIYAAADVPGVPLPGVTRKNQASTLVKITTDGPPPLIGYNGVVSSADFASSPFDGGLATIFGTGLTDANGVVTATSVPLPTELAGASVWVNGVPAPILAVASVNGQQQINFQMPFTFPASRGNCGSPGIVVGSPHGFGFALDWGVWKYVNSGQPLCYYGWLFVSSVFGAYPGGAPAIVHSADNSLVTASNPVRAGEVIVIYATGLGAANPAVPLGSPTPLSPLSRTVFNPRVVIGTVDSSYNVTGVDASVQFSGLAPGLIGVYQLNVVVPQVASGQQSLFIQNRDGNSFGLPATIYVQ